MQPQNYVAKGGHGLRIVHTPGPAEKAGKSSKSMMKLADVSPHEGAVAVAELLKTANVFERRGDEEVSLVVS